MLMLDVGCWVAKEEDAEKGNSNLACAFGACT